MSLTGAAIRVGLPPLAAMFNTNGTAYAAPAPARRATPIEPRFRLLVQRQRDSRAVLDSRARPAPDYELTPCLAPLKSLRDDIHVISGIDNPERARAGAGQHPSQVDERAGVGNAVHRPRRRRRVDRPGDRRRRCGGESRFRSLQVGVCQESHGENIHRNLSWAGYDRALPPEMIPHESVRPAVRRAAIRAGSSRKKSVLDAVREDLADLQPSLGQPDRHRLDEHLTSVRELERAIASLPSDYGKNVKEPEDVARPDGLSAHRQDPVRSAWCTRWRRARRASRRTC